MTNPLTQNTCEILDSRLRPLCLLSPAETRAQQLPHHEIILFGLAARDLLLKAGSRLDLLAFTPLPACSTILETAQDLAQQILGISCPVLHLADIPPRQLTFGGIGHICAAILSPSLASALANPDLALISREDCPALAKRQLLTSVPEFLWGGQI